MYLKRVLLVVLALPLVPTHANAQITADQEHDYQRRIAALEERLAVVEGQLETLLRDRAAAAPAPSVPRLETAAAPVQAPRHFEMPPELIPEVGKIGAEVGVLASVAANPFDLNHGAFYGGYIDLPLLDRPAWLHGKLSYEILVGLSRSQTQVTSTSNVAQVANLAVLTALNPNGGLQNIGDALTGTGSAPFPVTTKNQLNLRLLQVVPFSFKYTSTAFDRWRIRPYGLLGFGVYVSIHDENPASVSSGVRADANLSPAILQAIEQAFGGTSPFGGPLVAGQIAQAPELVARGLPGGNGNIEIGLESGGGVEFRLTRTLSLGFDARYNKISGTNGNFVTYGSRIGFHF
jgi:hypothetical protein